MNDTRELSGKGYALLAKMEGLRLKPYNDQTGAYITEFCNGATIGYGHLISIHEWAQLKNGIDTATADKLLQRDIARFEHTIKTVITAPLNQHQFDALVILAFNIGAEALTHSTVVKMINQPSFVSYYPTLEAAWKAWKRSQGKIMPGLIKRREREWTLYDQGRYA